MDDGRFENFGTESLDDTRFASMIRKSLREVVEATLARAPGNAEHREEVRVAGQLLGNALLRLAFATYLPDIS